MKTLKKAVALISAATLAVGLCACSQTPKVPEIPKNPYDAIFEEFNDIENNFQNEDVYTEPETTVPENLGYETDNIKVLGDSYETLDRFEKFNPDTYLIAEDKDGRPYDVFNGMYIFSEDDDVKEYVITSNFDIYKDSNGIYHADEYLFTEVKGEIFYTFYSGFSGEFYVFSIDKDGTMYLNAFNESGKHADPEKINTPLYASVLGSDEDEKFCKVDKIEVGDNGFFYIEANGKKYYYGFNSIHYLYDVPSFNTKEMTADADKVFDYGNWYGFGNSPIFSKKNDTTALYYYYDSEEFSIKLVDGYSVKDIKKVVANQNNIGILMIDGAVYTGHIENNIIGTKLEKHEDASKLGAEGKILDLTSRKKDQFFEIVIVCDDNCLYELM